MSNTWYLSSTPVNIGCGGGAICYVTEPDSCHTWRDTSHHNMSRSHTLSMRRGNMSHCRMPIIRNKERWSTFRYFVSTRNLTNTNSLSNKTLLWIWSVQSTSLCFSAALLQVIMFCRGEMYPEYIGYVDGMLLVCYQTLISRVPSKLSQLCV